MGGIEMIKEIDPKEPIEFAWNAFVDEMGEQRCGATDAFKWAWEEARKQEREECAKLVEDSWMAFSRAPNSRLDITPFPELTYVAKAIRARGQE